jgi:hypothetical protein
VIDFPDLHYFSIRKIELRSSRCFNFDCSMDKSKIVDFEWLLNMKELGRYYKEKNSLVVKLFDLKAYSSL